MILWGRDSSVNVQKVLWTLDELHIPHDHRVVGGKFGGLDDPVFTGLTPTGRVPVMQDGHQVIWESHAILRYLGRKVSGLQATAAEVDNWMEFGSTTLQPPFIALFWQRVRMKPQDRSATVEANSLKSLQSALLVLERGLASQHKYLAGDDFSLADIAIGSLFYRLTDICSAILDDVPRVAAWHSRIASRPAYSRWIARSYDELRVQL